MQKRKSSEFTIIDRRSDPAAVENQGSRPASTKRNVLTNGKIKQASGLSDIEQELDLHNKVERIENEQDILRREYQTISNFSEAHRKYSLSNYGKTTVANQL